MAKDETPNKPTTILQKWHMKTWIGIIGTLLGGYITLLQFQPNVTMSGYENDDFVYGSQSEIRLFVLNTNFLPAKNLVMTGWVAPFVRDSNWNGERTFAQEQKYMKWWAKNFKPIYINSLDELARDQKFSAALPTPPILEAYRDVDFEMFVWGTIKYDGRWVPPINKTSFFPLFPPYKYCVVIRAKKITHELHRDLCSHPE